MSRNTFGNPITQIRTIRVEGITSSAPGKVHKVPRGSVVKIYPTSAGEATLYSTNTHQDISAGDNTNAEITGSGVADWDICGAGSVTDKVVQQVNVPVETVALVVASGVWVMEVTAQ